MRLLPYLACAYLDLGDEKRAEDAVLEGIERARAQGHNLALVELLRVRGMVLARRRSWMRLSAPSRRRYRSPGLYTTRMPRRVRSTSGA